MGARRWSEEGGRSGEIAGGRTRVDRVVDALLLHRLHHGFARFKAIQTGKAAGFTIHAAVLGHHRDQGQAMALADGEVVGVMGRRHLDATGTELGLDVLISHDRNLTPHQRQGQGLAHQGAVALITGVHRHTGIAEHRFRAGGGDF